MHYASSWKLDVIPVLLEAGASVNLLDEKGLSALWYAAHDYKLTKTKPTKSKSAITALMAAGADPHLGRSPLKDCRIEKTMKASAIIFIIFYRKSISHEMQMSMK